MLDQMKEEFEKWHGYPVTDDMDIHTAVAWDSWRIAWNAGAMAATVGLPELPTCTKSQTDDTRRCKACRETGAIHCSDPENCGGPWTVHLTPEINEECDHAWEGGADMSQERCSKCGLSFMRYVHSCCP